MEISKDELFKKIEQLQRIVELVSKENQKLKDTINTERKEADTFKRSDKIELIGQRDEAFRKMEIMRQELAKTHLHFNNKIDELRSENEEQKKEIRELKEKLGLGIRKIVKLEEYKEKEKAIVEGPQPRSREEVEKVHISTGLDKKERVELGPEKSAFKLIRKRGGKKKRERIARIEKRKQEELEKLNK